jgi:hypothetical protein
MPLAVIAMPTTRECLLAAAPIAAFLALRWFLVHADEILGRLFPHRDWELRLGWLNIAAYRRADAALRWLGYVVDALLALALLGIAWGAEGVSEILGPDPAAALDGVARLPFLLLSCVLWALYLAGSLVPALRERHEAEELHRYRAENPLPNEKTPASSRGKPAPTLTIWDSPPRRR